VFQKGRFRRQKRGELPRGREKTSRESPEKEGIAIKKNGVRVSPRVEMEGAFSS